MSTFARLLTAALLAILAIGCSAAKPTPPQTIEVPVADPPGEAQRIEVPLGTEVTFKITTPNDDHAHLHGYEIERKIPAGETVAMTFTANMAGSYELESHVTDSIWVNLVVT